MASTSVALQAPATGCGAAAHARHAPCLRPRPAHAQPAASSSGRAPAAAAPVQPQRPGWGQRRAPAPVRAAAAGQQEALWENQVRDGRVKSVDARGAAALMEQGWVLLDVRPPNEVAKVSIRGAVAVPLFVAEARADPASLLKRFSAWSTGGWWLGSAHMVPNPAFMDEVKARVPLDAKVIVGCQRGLRSLSACERLSRAGYQTLAWVNGGFDTAAEGDLPTTPDNKDIRFAGIGGASEALGWTEVQQQHGGGFMGGAEVIVKVVAIFLAVDLLIFAYEYWSVQQAGGALP